MITEELEHSVTSSMRERLTGAAGQQKANSVSENVDVVSGLKLGLISRFATLSPRGLRLTAGVALFEVFRGVRSPKGSLQLGGIVKKFFCSLNAKSSTTIGSSESALIKILSCKKVQSIRSVSN